MSVQFLLAAASLCWRCADELTARDGYQEVDW